MSAIVVAGQVYNAGGFVTVSTINGGTVFNQQPQTVIGTPTGSGGTAQGFTYNVPVNAQSIVIASSQNSVSGVVVSLIGIQSGLVYGVAHLRPGDSILCPVTVADTSLQLTVTPDGTGAWDLYLIGKVDPSVQSIVGSAGIGADARNILAQPSAPHSATYISNTNIAATTTILSPGTGQCIRLWEAYINAWSTTSATTFVSASIRDLNNKIIVEVNGWGGMVNKITVPGLITPPGVGLEILIGNAATRGAYFIHYDVLTSPW